MTIKIIVMIIMKLIIIQVSDLVGSELFLNRVLRRHFVWYRNICFCSEMQAHTHTHIYIYIYIYIYINIYIYMPCRFSFLEE
jgi:hypothetical protein